MDEYDSSLVNAITTDGASIRACLADLIDFSPIHVSTQTIEFYTDANWNIQEFNKATLDSIKTSFKINGVMLQSISLSGVDDISSSRFKNAKFLKIREQQNGRRKCFMLFSNGTIQVKGCQTAVTAAKMCNMIVNGVYNNFDSTTVPNHVLGFKVLLINTNFSTNRIIDLDALHQVLKEEQWLTEYNIENHAAVNISIMYGSDQKKLSILVFAKGNIIITGASTPKHITSCYAFIGTVFQKHPNVIQGVAHKKIKGPPQKRGRKRKADTDALYALIDL